MVRAIRTGSFKTVKDIVKFMPITTDIPELADGVRVDVGLPLSQIISDYLGNGKQAQQLGYEILETTFIDDFPDDFQNAPVDVLDSLYGIQAAIGNELFSPLIAFNEALKALDEQLKQFSLTNDGFQYKVGTVAYERWSTFQMDLPCSKAVTTTYKKSGFTKKSSKYREFSKCGYSSQKAQYPKRQVPYVKIRG